MSNLSLLGKAMLDFSWMSASQIAALIIAIVFSVISVATSILAFKYAKKLDSFLKSVAMTMVAPFLAVTAWLFLIFSFLDAFRKDEVLNIVMSILIALFLCGVVIIVAKALYAKNGSKLEAQDNDGTIEGTFEDQSNALPANNTLLIEDEKKAEESAEEVEAEEVAALNAEEEAQPVETEEESTEEVAEETTEETTEEPAEEPAEEAVEEAEEPTEEVTEEPAEEVEEPAEEVTEETIEEPTEEPAEGEPVEEKTEEVYDVDGNNDEEDEEDDDEDEEFKKFIESLRERNRMRSDDTTQGDDNK